MIFAISRLFGLIASTSTGLTNHADCYFSRHVPTLTTLGAQVEDAVVRVVWKRTLSRISCNVWAIALYE